MRYRNRGPWLGLAKVSSVTYRIQRHAGADLEIVLMPYQADFGRNLKVGCRMRNQGDTESRELKLPHLCCLRLLLEWLTDLPMRSQTGLSTQVLRTVMAQNMEGDSSSQSAASPRRTQRQRQGQTSTPRHGVYGLLCASPTVKALACCS